VVPVVRVPGEVIAELGRSLGVGNEVVEGFVDWLLGNYLVRYPSVGLVRLVIDVLGSGDPRVVRFRRALGINSTLDVEVNINDPLFARLLTAVRSVVRALAKAGLIEYTEDLEVVNLVRGGGDA
jgi:hypothetical protein